MRKYGYDADTIIHKTRLSPKYVKDIVFLFDQGEERLIEGVQRGAIPLTSALEIARAKDDDESLGEMFQEAYEIGELNLRQIIEIKRLVEKRQAYCPGLVITCLARRRASFLFKRGKSNPCLTVAAISSSRQVNPKAFIASALDISSFEYRSRIARLVLSCFGGAILRM